MAMLKIQVVIDITVHLSNCMWSNWVEIQRWFIIRIDCIFMYFPKKMFPYAAPLFHGLVNL
jgi:hypothetical protein